MSLFRGWFKKYRIVEMGGVFVVQRKGSYGWEGLDKRETYKWTDPVHQIKYCGWDTLEEAQKFLENRNQKVIRYA